MARGAGAVRVCAGVRNSSQDRRPGLGQAKRGERVFLGASECSRGQRRQAGQSGSSVSPQETSVPEELLVTVVKPGLPTVADLHVLVPPPRPTRKRSLTGDKVSPVTAGPRFSRHRPGFAASCRGLGGQSPPAHESHGKAHFSPVAARHRRLALLHLWRPHSEFWWPPRSLCWGLGRHKGPGARHPMGRHVPPPFPFCCLALVTPARADCEGHGLPWCGAQDRAELGAHAVSRQLHCTAQLPKNSPHREGCRTRCVAGVGWTQR